MGSNEDDIHSAARNGKVTDVELIISSNPLAANARDKHSRTPGIEFDRRKFLFLGGNFGGVEERKRTASFMPRAWAGHANVVSALCKHKADVGAAAMDDMAAIHFAAQKGHLEVVKTLVSSGASVKATNRKGMTALHYAVQGSYVELTKYLLKKGFNLHAKTKAGKSVFDLATNEEIRTLLLEYEKKKETEVPANKETATEEVKDGDTGAPLEEKGKEENLAENDEENLKRKGKEDDVRDSSPKPKKSKVALNHLLASDDTQEDEEQ